MRAPARTISASAPFSASMVSTWREPGLMVRLTSGCTVLPFRMAATFIISRYDELVHEPMQT